MKKKVCSGLAYYYTCTDRMSGIVSTKVEMTEIVDVRLLEEAVNEALECYKDYKVMLEVSNNVLYFVDNPNFFRVMYGVQKENCIIRDTQGYLFSIQIEENWIVFDFFHLLTDGIGFFIFLKAVLYLYLKKKHPTDRDWDTYVAEITKNIAEENSCEQSLFLEHIADTARRIPEALETETTPENFMQIYDTDDEDRFLCVHVDNEKLKSITGQWQIKPYVLMNVIFGNAIDEVFQREEKNQPIVAYMPVDMRRVLKLEKYMYGCLSYTNIPYVKQENYNTLQEQCVAYANKLPQEMDFEKAFKKMKADTDLIKIMQKESMSISKKKNIVQRVMQRTEQYRGTFCMSYIPFLKESDTLFQYVKDFQTCIPRSGMGIMCEMIQVGDRISLSIRYQAHCEDIVWKIVEEIKKLGIFIDCVQENVCDLHIALPE